MILTTGVIVKLMFLPLILETSKLECFSTAIFLASYNFVGHVQNIF